jgi:ABC-type sugar transport system ATPase subunit
MADNVSTASHPTAARQTGGRIELRDLVKEYPGGVTAVKGVSLEIEPGELMVFLGPSGCGKTTTLRMIAGLEDPTAGEILLDGQPIQHQRPEERNVSMVFQDLALYPSMTVRDNVAFPLKARKRTPKLSKEQIEERVLERAQMLGIESFLDRRVSQLSGGQRQRVALARALVREPIAFLMDEAFASLDAVLKRGFWTEFKRFQRLVGTMMIHVTHDQEEATMMADRIAVFSLGEIVQVGTPDEVFGGPVTRFVAEFVGSPPMNILPMKVIERDGLAADGFGATVPIARTDGLSAGGDIGLGIRPQRARWGRSDAPDMVNLAARVSLVESVGASKLLICVLDGAGEPFEVRAIIADDDAPEEGATGHLSFRLAHAVMVRGTEPSAPVEPWLAQARAKA